MPSKDNDADMKELAFQLFLDNLSEPAEQMEERMKLWRKYLAAESESEQDALLKKICPSITPEGLEIMRRKMPEP